MLTVTLQVAVLIAPFKESTPPPILVFAFTKPETKKEAPTASINRFNIKNIKTSDV